MIVTLQTDTISQHAEQRPRSPVLPVLVVQQPEGLSQLDHGGRQREGRGELDQRVHEVRELVLGQEVRQVQEEVLHQPQLGGGGRLAQEYSYQGVKRGRRVAAGAARLLEAATGDS